jgi:hypothetical protein
MGQYVRRHACDLDYLSNALHFAPPMKGRPPNAGPGALFALPRRPSRGVRWCERADNA